MGSNLKISIIVPVFNAEKYIDRCMDAIYAQTLTDYEIILVNDGSTDRSAEICKGYAEKDKRITLINKENGGAGSARNMGIEVSRGEYLAFPDIDDWFEKDMYETLYDIAKQKDYDIVFSGVNYYGQTDGEPKYLRSEYCKNIEFLTMRECRENVMELFPTSCIFDVPWNKLYRRETAIKNNIRFSDTRRCQDAMFNIDFYNAACSVATSDKAFYNYILNTAEGVNRKFPKNYIDINIAYFTKLITILDSWGMYKGEIKKHYDTSFVIAIYETMGMFNNPYWKMNKAEQKEYIKTIMAREQITKFIKAADIREDVLSRYDIIKRQDCAEFLRKCKIEKFKEKIRNNKLIIGLYRKMRKI